MAQAGVAGFARHGERTAAGGFVAPIGDRQASARSGRRRRERRGVLMSGYIGCGRAFDICLEARSVLEREKVVVGVFHTCMQLGSHGATTAGRGSFEHADSTCRDDWPQVCAVSGLLLVGTRRLVALFDG